MGLLYLTVSIYLKLLSFNISKAKFVKLCHFHEAHNRWAAAQWLRCCATNRKVAGSIPGCVSGFFIDIKSFRSHYDPGVDSASNRNEYQEHFLWIKAAGA